MSSGSSRPPSGASTEPATLGARARECLAPADEPRLGKAILQSAHQSFRIIAELDGTHAFGRGCDQNRTERALPDRKVNDMPAAAAAELRRCHAEQGGRGGVETAVGVETRAIDRFGHRLARGELLAHAPGPIAGGIGPPPP